MLPQNIQLRNGVELPRVGLGTFKSKGPDVAVAVSWALRNGIKHVDTASIYKVCMCLPITYMLERQDFAANP